MLKQLSNMTLCLAVLRARLQLHMVRGSERAHGVLLQGQA